MPIKKYGHQLSRKCVECGKKYAATRVNQKYCSKSCSHKAVYRNTLRVKDHRKTIAENKDAKKALFELEKNQLNNHPNNIVGKEALADYLNIGFSDLLENLSKKWVEFPVWDVKTASGYKIPVYKKDEIDVFFKTQNIGNPRELTLALKGYKEPLRPVEKGFGYQGVLLQTEDGEYVQCHICGKLFRHMSGHIFQTHKMYSKEYKDKFQLSRDTSLASEKQRWFLKEQMLNVLKNMTAEELAAWKQSKRENIYAGRLKMKPHGRKKALEAYNKLGTCPDQLIQKIKDAADSLGKTPTLKEFVTFCGTQQQKHLIFKVYGSWNKAVELAGLNKAVPRVGGKKKLPGKNLAYEDDDLLEYLKIFAEENDEIPTHTDFLTGLLPNEKTYSDRFGSIHKARELAGVYNIVSKEKVDLFFRRNGNHPRKPGFSLPQIKIPALRKAI